MIYHCLSGWKTAILLFIYIVLVAACDNGSQKKPVPETTVDNTPASISFKVLNIFPHDTSSFTEGFLVHTGELWEGTGHTNSFPDSRSLFGIVDLKNGQINVKAEIDKEKYFGEGISFIKNRVYQLTDTTHIGFIYDANTFRKLGNFYYEGEGWGLTSNGTHLLMSNGSSNIYYRDPSSFKIQKTLNVRNNDGPVPNLNELELIHGYLYANQWQTNYILKIDTTTGEVVGRLDLSSLKTESLIKYPDAQETNGIAFDSAADKIYVTGKRWPAIYQISFAH